MLAWVVIDRTTPANSYRNLHLRALCVSALSSPTLSVQPLSFQPLTHYPRNGRPQPFAINPLRTLFISTEGGYPQWRCPHDSDPLECLSHVPYLLYFQSRAHSFALFCTPQKLNSFIFKRFRTLCQKHPGGGRGALLPETATPFRSDGAAAERACRLQERRSGRLLCCQ